MAELPDIAAAARHRAYQRTNMSMLEFLAQTGMLADGETSEGRPSGLHVGHSAVAGGRGNATHSFAYAAMLHDWGIEYARQVASNVH